MTKTHFRTCNLCEAMCGLKIEYEGGTIHSIKGDPDDPFSKGYICPKAVALQDINNDPDRLKRPIKKVNGKWVEIAWKEALDEVATRLKEVQRKYGNDAVGIYQGNPSVHNMGTMLFGPSFTRSLRTKNKFSATSVDQLPHHFVSQFMLGHLLLLPVPDIDRTDYFLVIGANPIASNGSIMSAAGMPHRIKELKKRGGSMVVVDPRRTETAEKADEHIFIKPGTDVHLLAALVHVLFKDNLAVDPGGHYKHFQRLPGLFEKFKPATVQDVTGVDERKIKDLAHRFAQAQTAVCYGRIGVSTQEHGTLCQYLIYLLNMLTGNFDRPGGMMLPTPAVDVVKAFGSRGTMKKFNRWQSRVRQLPEFGGELPVATMAEEILSEGEGQIKAMVTSAGNPVLSTPNGQQLEKAFESLEFMASIDIYLNETTRHADIILPPATGLEVPHYDFVFNNLAVRNTAKYSPALFNPAGGVLYDWQIFKQLDKRMRKQGLVDRLITYLLTPERMLNEGLKRGPYQLKLKDLKKQLHGVDLGPLKPCLPDRLFTEDKKVDLVPEILLNALQNLKSQAGSGLLLIGRRHLRSNNSWMHNSERLVKGNDRCTVMINPSDAAMRNILDQQQVVVASRVGEVRLQAQLDEGIMPGVVSIPHGWGHHRQGTNWKVAESHAGASMNDLTDELLIDQVSGNASLSGVSVEVSPVN